MSACTMLKSFTICSKQVIPKMENTRLEGLYVPDHYEPVECIRVGNIVQNTINLIP